jgi:hypothetical protein
MSTGLQPLLEELKPRISVSVSVEYDIDPRGTARVKDRKILKNDGSVDANLHGEFKQAINHNATGIKVSDSHGKNYPYKINRGDDHHQVAVAIEVPEGTPFTIEAGSERSLIFEYEMSEATTTLKGGLEPTFLINNRFGAVSYQYEFATIEYNIKYHITKLTNAKWWQRIFLRPALSTHPPDMAIDEDKAKFHVEYHFSCDAKSVKYVHMALVYEPRYWLERTVAFLIGVASSAIAASAPKWLHALAKLFGG